MDPDRWQRRLTELIAEHGVPAASVAVSRPDGVHAFAAGVLNLDTGVEATPDSLFQIGSVTKVWTATQIMLLVEAGRLTVDTPVVEALPEFGRPDPGLARSVTVRHLLSHTSGIDGDLFLDTGRGDGCVARYVAACAELPQLYPLGATQSYCNAGFVILGRVVERLTGKVWDAALREQIVEPLGLTHTWTLPEDVLRFRAATGHLGGEGGEPVHATPVWGFMRSAGPAGLICASASDVVAFARSHLDGGLLSAPALAAMREPQVRLPSQDIGGTHWGLGWVLDDWDGHQVLHHGGDTIGQGAALWAVPDAGLAVCMLANGGRISALRQALATELFGELGLTARQAPRPPAEPAQVDAERYAGLYERTGLRMAMSARDGGLRVRMEPTGPTAALSPPVEIDFVAADEVTFLGRYPGSPLWSTMVFLSLPDGSRYAHFGTRANPRIA